MASLEAFFLPTERGRRFCVVRRSTGGVSTGRGMLYLHPFAEEMNKTRRMAALGATAFADAGWTVLSIDCGGCGDSEGDFGDADWAGWVADALEGYRWLREQTASEPWLWGLRAGSLLASSLAAKVDAVPGMLLWQPVLSGSQHLTQFLRFKVAGGAMAGSSDRGSTQALREILKRGESIEVAGYKLTPAMAEGMDNATFRLSRACGRVVWGEASSAQEPGLTPVSRQHVTNLEASGVCVSAFAVRGPSFWQTVEVEEAPDLISSTLTRLPL